MMKMRIMLGILTFIASSCGQAERKQTESEINTRVIQDTLIVKHKNILNDSTWYSRSYSYYWFTGKDTLDFKLHIAEWKKDSTLHLRLFHKYPILFTNALEEIDRCLSLIKEDFNVMKITSFQFEKPIFYLDLIKNLSNEYEQKFDRRNIRYAKFNQFLLESSLTSQLNHFLNPLNKKVKHYGLEKLEIITKEDYNIYLPNIDFTEYPGFTFNAYTGISVDLENK